MNFFTRTEILITTDPGRLNRAEDILEANGIKFKDKASPRNHMNLRTNNRGAGYVGAQAFDYYLFVHHKDEEKARYLIRDI